MSGFQSAIAVVISGAFVFGMIVVLLGSIRQLFMERLQIPAYRADWLLAGLNLTMIPMILVSGRLVDQLDIRAVFLVGSLITSAGVLALSMSRTLPRTLGSILATGIGAACLSSSSTVLMAPAFFGEAHEAASQNLGNVFFALGALVTPTLTPILLQRLGYQRALTIIAVICLIPAIIAALTAGEAFPKNGEPLEMAAVLNNPLVWLAGIVFLLYGPLEGSLGSWGTWYLTDMGIRPGLARWLLTGFWATFLAARLLASSLEHGILSAVSAQAWFIVGLAVAAGVVIGNMSGARGRLSPAIGVLFIGVFLGPIFPTLVGILLHRIPEARGSAYGAMFAIGAAGNLVLPAFIGANARRTTVHHAMRIPMVMALLMALAAAVLALYPPTQGR